MGKAAALKPLRTYREVHHLDFFPHRQALFSGENPLNVSQHVIAVRVQTTRSIRVYPHEKFQYDNHLPPQSATMNTTHRKETELRNTRNGRLRQTMKYVCCAHFGRILAIYWQFLSSRPTTAPPFYRKTKSPQGQKYSEVGCSHLTDIFHPSISSTTRVRPCECLMPKTRVPSSPTTRHESDQTSTSQIQQ